MNHAVHAFETRLAASWPPPDWKDVVVVVATSGGADSVALLRALERLKTPGTGHLVAAHFNHALRGGEADADESFVIDLCRRLGLAWRVARAESGSLAGLPDGLEAAARRARYRFLAAIAAELGARYLVTAHSADDQAETILHHVLRGTGLAGLAGIPRTRRLTPAVTLLRPMLEIGRQDVETYLASLGQPFRADSTNRDTGLTRNRIREMLMPLLAREFNADVARALRRLGRVAGDAQRVIEAQAQDLLDAALRDDETGSLFDCERLARADRHVAREAFVALWKRKGWPAQAMGFEEWDSLAALALEEGSSPPDSGSPGSKRRREFPGGVIAARSGDALSVRRPPVNGGPAPPGDLSRS